MYSFFMQLIIVLRLGGRTYCFVELIHERHSLSSVFTLLGDSKYLLKIKAVNDANFRSKLQKI